MRKILVLAMTGLALLVLMGCVGRTDAPTVPAVSGNAAYERPVPGNRDVWGLYEVTIDVGRKTAEVVPLRTAMLTANVNNLLEAKPNNLIISDLDLTNYFTEGRVDCTVTLKHPFPGLYQFDGFDVWGVFLHNGISALNYDSLTYSGGPEAYPDEATLLNADGYTRWFNQPEFDGSGAPILEYWPGKLASLPMPTATLNPYRVFADDLGLEDDYYQWIITGGNAANRGMFRAGQANSRRYQLKFPIIGGAPVLTFQYEVVASWETGDPSLTGDPSTYDPGDFPTSANVEEAFFIRTSTVGSELYNDGAGHAGGTFRADIEVFDWQGGSVGKHGVPNEINRMIFEGDFLTGGKHEFSKAQLAAMAAPATENSSVFQVEIAGCSPKAGGQANFWVIVEAAGLNGASYGQGYPTQYPDYARRAAFLQSTVSVAGVQPPHITVTSPNGGENWVAGSHHDIKWVTGDYSGMIKLEYSKDDFVSDTNSIAPSTEDDGVFDWLIPKDQSDTVRVRATLLAKPEIFDDSNADFSIKAWTDPVQIDTQSHMPRAIQNALGEVVLIWYKDTQGIRYSVNTGSGWSVSQQAYNTNPTFMHIVADKADHTVYASYKGWGENMDDRHALRWTGGAGAWNYMWLYGWTGQPSILMPDDDGSFTHIYTFMGILEVIGFPSWGSAWSGMVGMDSTNVRMASTNFHERDDTFNLVSYHRDNGADINSAQFVRILKTNIGSYTVRTILQGASGDTVDAPGLCMDKTGKLHVAFRVVSGSTSMVKYADSTDTGNNWSTPLTIVSGADTILDEHVGIDTDSNNRIYVTYTQGPFIYMSYSDDGVAWNEPMAMYKGALPIGYHYTQPFPLVTSDNSLHIFYILKDSIFDYGNLFETTWK